MKVGKVRKHLRIIADGTETTARRLHSLRWLVENRAGGFVIGGTVKVFKGRVFTSDWPPSMKLPLNTYLKANIVMSNGEVHKSRYTGRTVEATREMYGL